MTTMPESYWIKEEMKRLELGDKRLEERTRKILYDFSQNPTGSIPQFCPDGAAVKGVYGYCLENPAFRSASLTSSQSDM